MDIAAAQVAARDALEELVRLPSVSADPAADLRQSAAATADLFHAAGMPDVEIIDSIPGGQPAVLASYPAAPGRPTVLLYAHHDVQPAGDLREWTSPPFTPEERQGRLYGRGVADNKAGIAAHLAAVLAHRGAMPVGVTVLVEGEEEITSPTLGALLDKYHDRLAADLIVLADSENLELGTPAFTTSLRGTAACIVELRMLETAVHSGVFGGAAPDALTALCRLLATLHDDRGDVAVAGLLAAEAPRFDYPEQTFRAEAGLLEGVELTGSGNVAGRLWARPAATVLAIDATPVSRASNVLAAGARAKVGLRVAPGDDAGRAAAALAEHLDRHAPWGGRVTVEITDIAQPHHVDTSGWQFDVARRAYGEAYGRGVVQVGSGGSIPFVAEFTSAFPTAAVLITSAGADNHSRPHGIDESIDIGEFERACLAEALLIEKLAERGPGSPVRT